MSSGPSEHLETMLSKRVTARHAACTGPVTYHALMTVLGLKAMLERPYGQADVNVQLK